MPSDKTTVVGQLKWCQEQTVYQIYPRSFQDSNGDGVGDIPGIISRLDEIRDLGIGIIWLSPVYASPDIDFGYDISDYRAINPEFGTMDDMKQLLAEAAARGIRIIMDLVINHTSDQHEWFQASRDPLSPYRDWYFWRPGRNGKPPSNWTGFFGGPCWTLDEKSGEYYLHLFAVGQPDLNYHNPVILSEVEDIMRFWLDLGVAGFRCDVINLLCKESLEDGRPSLILTGSEHYLTREGTHEILRCLRRDVLDHYDCFTVGETVFVTPQTGRELCAPARRELDMIFSFEHMEADQIFVKWFKRPFSARKFAKALARWQAALEWNANYLENHDQPRSISRFGDDSRYRAESAKLLAVLLFTLRGTPFVYQGQEIGMTNFDFTSMDQLRDVESHNIYGLMKQLHFPAGLRWRMIRATSRDNARTPMQWDDTANGGFTNGTPWLGVNANHKTINLAAQKKDPDSVLNFYKTMIRLRAGNETLKRGEFRLLSDGRLMAFERHLDGDSLTIILNFSARRRRIPRRLLADGGSVLVSSSGRKAPDGFLAPYEALILQREVKP